MQVPQADGGGRRFIMGYSGDLNRTIARGKIVFVNDVYYSGKENGGNFMGLDRFER